MKASNQGYIVIKIGCEGATSVVCLSRGGKTHPPRWITHSALRECFVYPTKSIRRAVRRNMPWVREAMSAHAATYNSESGYAELNGGQIPFSQLKEQLGF